MHLKPLTLENFKDYESITAREGGGGCYCSFWHQKWGSYKDWQVQCKSAPEKNRETVLGKVRDGFHVGTVVYEDNQTVGWISVGLLPEFYWTSKRVAALGEAALRTAALVCITASPEYRGKGFQERALQALIEYGRLQKWDAIEGYPFDESTLKQHGDVVFWPGFPRAYEKAGFKRIGPHWLNSADAARSIYQFKL